MTLEPIISAKLDKFKKDYEIIGSEDEIFEQYINYQILELLYPGINDTGTDLLEKVCVGGGLDMGIDGIVFLVNGSPVCSRTDIDDFLQMHRKIDFQFIFIQSKNKRGFNHGEFEVFLRGVEDFLRPQITLPANDYIKYWHDIYEYASTTEVMLHQSKQPEITLYYVTIGKWNQQEHIVSDFNNFKEHMRTYNSFEEPQAHYIDSVKLLDIINSNENYYETTISYVESMSLPEAAGTKKSAIVLCNADEIVNLITNDEKILRKNIFDDNVRDFQGLTEVNYEMKETLESKPEQFLLLNNGITAVCDEIDQGNRRIIIRSPQVVNGCQTCNVLYECYKEGIDLSKAMAVVKLISSDDSDIINSIVRGTNRQNIVYEEAFETTRDFHKSLEKFFVSFVIGEMPNLYYERRSKQYENDPIIKPSQKVNLRIIIQSMVGLFLGKPEQSYMHESRLLKEYKGILFVDGQSYMPYYTAAFIFKNLDSLFRSGKLPKQHKSFLMHLAFILVNSLNGRASCLINNNKIVDQYCKGVLDKIDTQSKLEHAAQLASEKFDAIREEWIRQKGDSYRSAIKDNPDFTAFMKTLLDNNENKVSEHQSKIRYRGKILNIHKDIHNELYGFIQRTPNNVFFHANDNPGIDEKCVGKDAEYDVITNKNGQKAANVTIIE